MRFAVENQKIHPELQRPENDFAQLALADQKLGVDLALALHDPVGDRDPARVGEFHQLVHRRRRLWGIEARDAHRNGEITPLAG